MKKSLIELFISRILHEEIGRNHHTIDNDPLTWDKFDDFDIEYYDKDDGTCLIDISFKNEKIVSMQLFGSRKDAESFARTIVDKTRVEFMNAN